MPNDARSLGDPRRLSPVPPGANMKSRVMRQSAYQYEGSKCDIWRILWNRLRWRRERFRLGVRFRGRVGTWHRGGIRIWDRVRYRVGIWCYRFAFRDRW